MPSFRPPASRLRQALLAGLVCVGGAAWGQDAVRGAQIYLQLPAGVVSCIGCHGPDPSQNPNNILRAADRPAALLQALNTVSAMGYLRQSLSDTDVADLAAYLGRVLLVADPGATVAVWPTTIEFGSFVAGDVVPVHRVELRNLGSTPLALAAPLLQGPGHTATSDCAAELAPRTTCRIELRALATTPGPAAATLVLGGASVGTPRLVGVSSTVRDGPLGRLSTDLPAARLELGPVETGAAAVREFALLSHGSAPVTLGPITLTGPQRAAFRVEGDCVRGLVLAPGSRCTMRLRFAPTAAIEAAATLQWRSDGANPGTLALTGSGVAPAAPAPEPAPPGGGGGCSVGPPARPVDPLHPSLLVLAAALLWGRRRPRR